MSVSLVLGPTVFIIFVFQLICKPLAPPPLKQQQQQQTYRRDSWLSRWQLHSCKPRPGRPWPPRQNRTFTGAGLTLTTGAPIVEAGRMAKPTGTGSVPGLKVKESTQAPGTLGSRSLESTLGQGRLYPWDVNTIWGEIQKVWDTHCCYTLWFKIFQTKVPLGVSVKATVKAQSCDQSVAVGWWTLCFALKLSLPPLDACLKSALKFF